MEEKKMSAFIKRSDAMMELYGCTRLSLDRASIIMSYVPSVGFEKHGKWKIEGINTYELADGTTGYEPVYECSECGLSTESYLRLDEPVMPRDADFPKFCQHCGARMEESDETD